MSTSTTTATETPLVSPSPSSQPPLPYTSVLYFSCAVLIVLIVAFCSWHAGAWRRRQLHMQWKDDDNEEEARQ